MAIDMEIFAAATDRAVDVRWQKLADKMKMKEVLQHHLEH